MSIGAHHPSDHAERRDTEFWLAQARIPRVQARVEARSRSLDLIVPMALLAGAALLLAWVLTAALFG